MRIPTLLVVLLCSAHNVAWSQLDARVRMGARVRVNSSDAQIIGRVAEVRDDTIVVDRGMGDTASVPLRDVGELAVYHRGTALAKTLAVIGAASGAALYINWCLKAPQACENLERQEHEREHHDDDDEDEEMTSVFSSVVLTFGAIGMLIGHTLTPPQWHRVDLPVRFGIAPMHNGVGVYVSLPAPTFTFSRR
ncbi:MAG: hypothetical protein ACREOK_16100 [Gemmatimonadaceae bacterium]